MSGVLQNQAYQPWLLCKSFVQSTISQGFSSLEKGEKPKARHFALINKMDGFFLVWKTG